MSDRPVLTLGVLGARDLLAEDLNGFSDPFVEISLLDQRGDALPRAPVLKTPVIKKTLNPEWTDVRFVLGDGVHGQGIDLRGVTTLRLVVLDYDGFKSNDTLGVVDLPMDVLLRDELPGDAWFDLKRHETRMTKEATGALHLSFLRGRPAAPAAPIKATGNAPNLLYVTIDSGRDLLAMDRGNTSDPFVKLSVVGQKYQTSTIEKTLKPHWDEAFAFRLEDPHNTLELVVEDEDRTVNDFLGRAQLVLADVLVPEAEQRVTVKLLDKKFVEDKDRGTLQLRLRWVHEPNADTITASMQKRKRQVRSLVNQLKSSLHIGAQAATTSERDEIQELLDDEEILQDESDDDTSLPLPPDATRHRFLTVTVHRAEELPPLDALTFEKEKHKPHAPGGGIDAYVAAWLVDRPEDFIRTRIHTRKGRRDELSTSFHESLMLALPADTSVKSTVKLAIMDWDQIGGDEVVSHLELPNVEALVAAKGQKPFWWNMYGAPLVGFKNKEAVAAMNEDTEAGSTYRGRVLLTLRLQNKPSTTYERKHQKRAAPKLPKAMYPAGQVYRLRAHFLKAVGLPAASGKYYVTLSCGMNEIHSTQKSATKHAVEWNETEESDRMVLPADPQQIPDILLCLCTGEWEKRIIVSYRRFRAAELLQQAFTGVGAQWFHMHADPTTEAVPTGTYAGAVQIRLGFGTLECASEQIWDQKTMIEQVTRRSPYNVRVRIHGIKSPSATASSGAYNIRVQCWDQEDRRKGVTLTGAEDAAPLVLSLNANLPPLPLAAPVLVHVTDSGAKPERPVGTLVLALDGDLDSPTSAIFVCTSQELKMDQRPRVPVARWAPLVDARGDPTATELYASAEFVRKTFPDEVLPSPEICAGAVPMP